jgi:undecaprenyl phosphate N,N'-diacetylbacillosamine 1-phosphate transferase
MKDFFYNLVNTWWGILIIVLASLLIWLVLSAVFYKQFFKRFYDIVFSVLALIILSPLLLIISILVRIKLGSHVIFKQKRPGKNCKIFTLHKFRTMTDKKDSEGNLLPDSERLTKFGKFLRSTSLDELPELWDILRGKMSFIGPRPLLVEYLPLYNQEQNKRHLVKSGLTGWAQVNGRNAISWDDKFKYDVEYVNKVSIWLDIKIFFKTIVLVFKRKGINQNNNVTMDFFMGNDNGI